MDRFAIKLFAASAPDDVLEKAIPVFHRWIQNHTVPGILVDVADYGHLPQSPGVVLVSHEANLALDATEGPLGLLYTRKTPLAGGLRAALGLVFDAASSLEMEADFGGKLRFRTNELWVLSNDRLAFPNTEDTFRALRPALEEVLRPVYKGKLDVVRDGADPRRRLTLRVSSPVSPALDELAAAFQVPT